MDKTPSQHRRRNYFIEKKFQARFILKFCSLVAAGGLLTVGLVYFLASRATTVSIVDSRVVVRSSADFILPLLVQTVAVAAVAVALATIALTLFSSHKIAGPLYRFKRVLEALEEGDFSRGFSIRDLDQLQIVADSLNQVVVRNKEQLLAVKEAFGALERKLEEGAAEARPEDQRRRIDEARAALSEAKKKLDYFKTS